MKLSIRNLKDATEIVSRMETDLNRLSAILKSDNPTDFSTITFPSPEKMKLLVNNVYTLSLSQNNFAQAINNRLLRLYLFLIDRHQTNIWPLGTDDELTSLNAAIQNLSESIGVVPRLSHQVVWADQKFLPPEINRNTKKKWQKQACAKPRRGKIVAENGIHFIGTPREALRESYSAGSVERIKTSTGDLYLNLIDFDYYKLGLMDADHLLASASLLQRLEEMIAAMNYDPAFAREMKNSIFNDNYFIIDSNGTIVGNYWLYMAYHNSIENIWLLLASDNSAGKGKEDPVIWLKQFEVGQKYLVHLGVEGKYIDKSDILYRVTDAVSSVSLKDSFTGWVRESHKHHLLVYFCEAQLHNKVRETIVQAGDRKGSLMQIQGSITAVGAHFFGSDSEASSFTSVSSDNFEPHSAELIESIISDPKIEQFARDTKKRINELGSETKQNVKKTRLSL